MGLGSADHPARARGVRRCGLRATLARSRGVQWGARSLASSSKGSSSLLGETRTLRQRCSPGWGTSWAAVRPKCRAPRVAPSHARTEANQPGFPQRADGYASWRRRRKEICGTLLGGVLIDDRHIPELAELVPSPLRNKLILAHRLRSELVALTTREREQILTAIEQAPGRLDEDLHNLILRESSWRRSTRH